jgi:hypothetical protein
MDPPTKLKTGTRIAGEGLAQAGLEFSGMDGWMDGWVDAGGMLSFTLAGSPRQCYQKDEEIMAVNSYAPSS